MVGGVAAGVGLVLFVVAHEAGHFVAARVFGMKATEFFVGFGPRIWSSRSGETEYGFKWILLGGYVRIVGMNPFEPINEADIGRTYRERPFWQKTVVVLSGIAVNLTLAFLMFYGLALATGFEGHPVPTVASTVAGSPAANAGLQRGDRIIAVNGTPILGWADAQQVIAATGPNRSELLVERAGEIRAVTVDLVSNPEATISGFLGVRPRHDAGPIEAIGIAGATVGETFRYTLTSVGRMLLPSSLSEFLNVFRGDTEVPPDIRPISPAGVITIGTHTRSPADIIGMLATVNVVLAALNLIPLPPLDGGHVAAALYEKTTKRVGTGRYLTAAALTVVAAFAFLGLTALILDLTNPIKV